MTRPALLLSLLAAGAMLGGCIGYTTYPPADGQLASDDINGPPADEIMIAALRHVIERNPPEGGGSVVVNLPPGVNDRVYGVIAYRIGPNVRAMARGLEDEPTYHVTRLWVRGNKAEIDILRPVSELGPSPTGDPIIQAVTVHLEGGMRNWRVERTRPWVIGTDALPQPHYIGEDGSASGASGEMADGAEPSSKDGAAAADPSGGD